MPWWGWTALGVAAYGWAWRWTFREAWECEPTRSWGDFWASAVHATFLSWFWVGTAAFEKGAKRWKPDRLARALGGESSRAKRQRRERELHEREERVRKLERELGIVD